MKTLTQIAMVSVATLALIGCSDSYNDTNTSTGTTDTPSVVDMPGDTVAGVLKVSNRKF